MSLTPIQVQFKNDWKHRFFMVTSGRRSRKTLLGTRKVLDRALRTPNGRFFHAAPTLPQARRIFWSHKYNSVRENTKLFWSQPPSEVDMTVYLINGSQISIVSLDKAARIEGATWDGGHITEFTDMHRCREMWDGHLRPLFADTGGFCIIDGVPDMYSPSAGQYKEMVQKYACGGAIPEPFPKVGAFAENAADPEWCFYCWLSSDVIAAEELERIRTTTDPKMFRQEWEGSFEQLSGLAYYAFTPSHYPAGNIDNDIKYDPSLPIYIGMDFNVDPMTATLAHHVKITDGEKRGQTETLVFRGYLIRNSNTRELVTRIFTEFPRAPYYVITPCQSSAARQTVADLGQTDVTVIESVAREMKKRLYIHRVTQNPRIKDRIQLTNARLYHKMIRIKGDDDGCKELLADWGTIGWKPGTSDLDLPDPMRGHISAGFDYSQYKHFDIGMLSRTKDPVGVSADF